MKPANFKVDTSLASILGENYRSTETALKELVDNAWDADAEEVHITMPEMFDEAEIWIRDNGVGMTEQEIRNEYLFIARSRSSRKGEYTLLKKRRIKGRKGIGKFAGLLVAGEMHLISKSGGVQTSLVIIKEDLLRWKEDLEHLDLLIQTTKCPLTETGTTIILKGLNQNLHFPNPLRLSQLLITEYGRENDFTILINDKPLDIEDLKGKSESGQAKLETVGLVNYKFTIAKEKNRIKQPGIALRVDGKIIGKLSYFGLENAAEIPKSLLKKIYAEVEADGLKEDVTTDWGAIFENSKKLEQVKDFINPKIKAALDETYQEQIKLTKARLKKKITRALGKLPESKQDFAERTLDKVLKGYYNESEDKINTVISVVLKTLEQDEYNEALGQIEKASTKKLSNFTQALSEFGAVELSTLSEQSNNRKRFLDQLENLLAKEDVSAADMQQGLEKNLWLLPAPFATMITKEVLENICTNYLNTKFPLKKPSLLLCQDYSGTILLIAFKAPTKSLGIAQLRLAEKYKADLTILFPNSPISVLMLGKKVGEKLMKQGTDSAIFFESYTQLILQTRKRMDFLEGKKE